MAQIDTQTLLTIVSVAGALYFAYKGNNRQSDSEVEKKAMETATINQKLDTIGSDVSDIKKDVSSVRAEVRDLSERVVIVEQSTKSAHHRIDNIEEDYPRKKKRKGY